MSKLNKRDFRESIKHIVKKFKTSCSSFLQLDTYKFGIHTDLISNLITQGVKLGFKCYAEAIKTSYHEYRQNSLSSRKETGLTDLVIINGPLEIYIEVEGPKEVYQQFHVKDEINNYKHFLTQHSEDLPSGIIFFYLYQNMRQKRHNYWNTLVNLIYESQKKNHLKKTNFFVCQYTLFIEEKECNNLEIEFKNN
ncbi:hypothetical protein LCGC14_0815980 [marine sediment metagenome]|uniref:Uncharacterized protein n=1 Tax=marine sediment metagenome TaxID=412755 RepID=A0A0F9PPX8_9ZZZZ